MVQAGSSNLSEIVFSDECGPMGSQGVESNGTILVLAKCPFILNSAVFGYVKE